jgi:hypothetical protein
LNQTQTPSARTTDLDLGEGSALAYKAADLKLGEFTVIAELGAREGEDDGGRAVQLSFAPHLGPA